MGEGRADASTYFKGLLRGRLVKMGKTLRTAPDTEKPLQPCLQFLSYLFKVRELALTHCGRGGRSFLVFLHYSLSRTFYLLDIAGCIFMAQVNRW